MNSVYLKSGKIFTQASRSELNIYENIPAGNYVLKYDNFKNFFFLEETDSFTVPSKLYGNTVKLTERIINTFNDRMFSTGVLLSGEKGSGKSMLIKNIGINLSSINVPCIIINSPFCGDSFNTFIQNINQPACIIFDEFEKIYDKKDQEKLLTLLDGVFASKKLFLISCNDMWGIDDHMINRPGRIYYHIQYDTLEVSFIEEYVNDNSTRKDLNKQIVQFCTLFQKINFDMVKAIVEEVNRYGETPLSIAEVLNTKIDGGTSFGKYYTITKLTESGQNILLEKVWFDFARFNPLAHKGDFSYEGEKEKYDVFFSPDNIVSFDRKSGTFTYQVDDVSFTIEEIKDKVVDYRKFLV